MNRRKSALLTLATVACVLSVTVPPRSAFAQEASKEGDRPAEPPSSSVPRGAGGAVVVPAQPPAAAAAPGKPTMPRPLNYAPPVYPPEAEKQGLEASVTLQLDIDKNGRVTQAVVLEPAGHGFDESSVEAAKKLEFEPARGADGTPRAARIFYRYSFTLSTREKGPTAAADRPADKTAAENLRGIVLATGGDVPLAGAAVTVRDATGRQERAVTDGEGRFAFKDLAPGRYRVTVALAGFDSLQVEEEMAAGEAIEVKYRLLTSAEGLEVVVRGARPPREVTKRTLERREISRIPGTNGDALRSIQNLPGVARPPGGIVGLLIVRGSAPQDTQTFVDGTIVPLIYHFGGLSSVIPTEMLEKIDFYPGNFSAQYGRVMGGIVDAGIRSPKDDGQYHGLVQIDTVDARALVEGPIPLLPGWRFTAAGRRSYIDAWLGPILREAGAGVTTAPVYYDYQLVVETNPTPSSTFRTAFFGSDDALEILIGEPMPGDPGLSGNFGLHTAFQRLQFRYENDFDEKNRFTGLMALGREDIDFGFGAFYFLLDILTLSGRLEYTHKFSKGAVLNAGVDMLGGTSDITFRGPAPPRPGEPANQPFSTRTVREGKFTGELLFPAAYLEMELAPSARAKIVPGVRVESYNLATGVDVSPRVNGRYDLIQGFPRTTIKAGAGIFHQPPQIQEALVSIFGTAGLRSNRAVHYALGAEQEITRRLEVSLEGFYKQMDRLVVGTPSPSGASIVYKNIAKGYAVGSELLIKYKPDERFFGWAAYTLSRSRRTDGPGQPEHAVPFDQTHILTVLGSYQLGGGWEFGARFRLVSGNLITPQVCNYEAEDCNRARINSLFHAASGAYTGIPFTEPYGERLPVFHQLDLRVDKRWKFKRWQLSGYLDIQNVYNNGNTEGLAYDYNYTTRQYVTGLPILPSIGLRADF